MSTWELIAEAAKSLPNDKQEELLEFAEFLSQRHRARRPLRSVRGLCKDLDIDIGTEEIDEAQREMWSKFPREDI